MFGIPKSFKTLKEKLQQFIQLSLSYIINLNKYSVRVLRYQESASGSPARAEPPTRHTKSKSARTNQEIFLSPRLASPRTSLPRSHEMSLLPLRKNPKTKQYTKHLSSQMPPTLCFKPPEEREKFSKNRP